MTEGLPYSLEKRLVRKLDFMIARCEQDNPKRDAALIVEGAEGEGKTDSSLACAYYVKKKTGRTITLFFSLTTLVEYAKTHDRGNYIWDEPALDALKQDWYKKSNADLMRLLMTARKKRHFYFFNFTKFYKFSEYIVVDRSLGMIHMYSRNEIEPGRFVYVRKKHLEGLYLGWSRSKKRLYKKFSSFRGSFPNIEKFWDEMDITVIGYDGQTYQHATYDDYNREKDKAISSIGRENILEKDKWKEELYILRRKLSNLRFPIKTQTEFAQNISTPLQTFRDWFKIGQKTMEFPEKAVLTLSESPNILKEGSEEDEDGSG